MRFSLVGIGGLWLALSLAPVLACAAPGPADPACASQEQGRPDAGDCALQAIDTQTEADDRTAPPLALDTAGKPPSRAATPSSAQSYARGRADRQGWEDWFNAQTGDAYAGAAFWAAQRSLKHRTTCRAAVPATAGPDWTTGCRSAQMKLAAFDRLRKTSRGYWRGWNSVPPAPAHDANPPTPVTPPATETGNPFGAIGLITIVGLVLALFVAARRKAGPVKPRTQTAPLPRAPARPAISESARTTPTRLLGAVGPEDLRRESELCWRAAGERVEVQGVTIDGGLIYVGARLRAKDGYGAPENALIDPALVASPGANPDSALSYWPSYSRLPPATRRAYLAWLAGDRADPNTNIGYVFLYFYGLERRLMLDVAADDRQTVVNEVIRLRRIYGANNSFRGYSGRLLNAASALWGQRGALTPVFEREGYEVPLTVRLALGGFAARREPVPPDWMLSWVLTDPVCHFRTPATRNIDTFKAEFERRWSERYPEGAGFSDARPERLPQLTSNYRSASNTFTVERPIAPDLPDVTGERALLTQAHQLALACNTALDAYGRLTGRRPELKGSLMAAALLPKRDKIWLEAQADLEARSRSDILTAADVVALVECAPSSEKVTPSQWRKAFETLATFGFGLAPDPYLSLARVSATSPANLYPLPDGSLETPDAMTAAALVLHVGALVAAADGLVSPEERQELEHAAEHPTLDARQNARLKAQVAWLLSHPINASDLRGRLAQASPETRGRVVEVALDIARQDGHIAAAEVRQLEHVFKWLDLPSGKLYSALNESGPVEIVAGGAAQAGEAIAPPPRAGLRLDRDRIAKIASDSARSTQLLQSVFAADEEEAGLEPPPQPPVPEEIGAFAGLSAGLAAFARAACARDQWPRTELETLARGRGVMLEGAIESLNEWALDRWGDLLVEDGEPVRVNRHFVAEEARVA